MVDALRAAVLRQGAVRGVGPVLPPRHDVLFLVPLPILQPEAFRADGPGGQHDVGVRVMAFLPAVEGDIRDHPPVHKGPLRVVAHERAAILGRQLAGNRHANLASDLRFPPQG